MQGSYSDGIEAPIYLIKLGGEGPVMSVVDAVVGEWFSPTHWAIEVRGQHYHLAFDALHASKRCALNKKNIPEERITPWKATGGKCKRICVGMTLKADYHIKQEGKWVCRKYLSNPVG